MMQIDCEVTDTQWLHLQEAVIPKHLRSQRQPEANLPKDTSTEMSEKILNITKGYKPYFMKDNRTNSLNNDNFKHEYTAEGKTLYEGKEAYPAKENFNENFPAEDVNDNKSHEEKNHKNQNGFANKAEELQKYPQDRRIFRRKQRRSTLQ